MPGFSRGADSMPLSAGRTSAKRWIQRTGANGLRVAGKAVEVALIANVDADESLAIQAGAYKNGPCL